jgi:hypothetical protein
MLISCKIPHSISGWYRSNSYRIELIANVENNNAVLGSQKKLSARFHKRMRTRAIFDRHFSNQSWHSGGVINQILKDSNDEDMAAKPTDSELAPFTEDSDEINALGEDVHE